jgi:ribonuclease HII
MKKWLVGVDEAGRGPLAGPVAVGVVCVPMDFDWNLLVGVNDSKKLTPEIREAIFKEALKLKQKGMINYAVGSSSAKMIDRLGIVPAIKRAQGRAFAQLQLKPQLCIVKLDGGLKAPEEFLFQETIIKGDGREKVIGLASILAKVTRDRYMRRIALQFAAYDFATHKGYGTKAHCMAINKHGLSSEHRVSFCRNLQK